MPSNDNENERLAHAEYWNERYEQNQSQNQSNQPMHEWFRSFDDLEEFFQKHLFEAYPPTDSPHILHLGSGDSNVPQNLAAKSYDRQLCVDFSSVVVEHTSKRHAKLGLSNAIRWEQMDVRNMESLLDASIDVAFDKGTLDAMVHGSPWCPPEDTLTNTQAYMREVSRVLKPDGVFLYVTYRQPHFVRRLLECDGTNWDVRAEILGASLGSFGYYGIVCKPRV